MFLLTGCGSLPPDVERPDSEAYRETGDTRLGRMLGDEVKRHEPHSGVLLLPEGPEAFVARLTLIEMAERGIDTQYYILENDKTGRVFIRALLAAADRGVRVRLLLDDINLADIDEALAVVATHPNLSIRVFNPFAPQCPPTDPARGQGEYDLPANA